MISIRGSVLSISLAALIKPLPGSLPFDEQKNRRSLRSSVQLNVYTFACCACFLAGIDFKIRTIELDGKKIKLQIWYVSFTCPKPSHELSAGSGSF